MFYQIAAFYAIWQWFLQVKVPCKQVILTRLPTAINTDPTNCFHLEKQKRLNNEKGFPISGN